MIKEAISLATTILESQTAVWRVALMLVVGAHVAWACSLLPGMPGFALAADVMNNTTKLAQIEKAVDCNAIESEIKRLRSELRDNETKLLEARQSDNQPLIQQIQRVISEINDDLQDEIERRRVNECVVA